MHEIMWGENWLKIMSGVMYEYVFPLCMVVYSSIEKLNDLTEVIDVMSGLVNGRGELWNRN